MATAARVEKRHIRRLGSMLGEFAKAVVEADSMAKDASIARYIELLERGNVDFRTNTSLIGMEQDLETGISVPTIAVAPIEPIVVEEAEIKTCMTVNAHQESSSEIKSTTKGHASTGFGMHKAGLSAMVSTDHNKKRSTDQSNTTEVRMRFVQGVAPIGLARIVDALSGPVLMKSLEINERLITKQAEALTEEVDEAEKLPKKEPGSISSKYFGDIDKPTVVHPGAQA